MSYNFHNDFLKALEKNQDLKNLIIDFCGSVMGELGVFEKKSLPEELTLEVLERINSSLETFLESRRNFDKFLKAGAMVTKEKIVEVEPELFSEIFIAWTEMDEEEKLTTVGKLFANVYEFLSEKQGDKCNVCQLLQEVDGEFEEDDDAYLPVEKLKEILKKDFEDDAGLGVFVWDEDSKALSGIKEVSDNNGNLQLEINGGIKRTFNEDDSESLVLDSHPEIKITLASEKSLYVKIGDWNVYIDAAGDERIVDQWKDGEEE